MHKLAHIIILFLLFTFVFPKIDSFADDEVRRSLSDCLNIGLANNLDIKIAKIEAMIEGEGILISEAIFDALITGKATYTDDQRASASTITGTKSLTTDYELSATKTLPTGTELTIDYSNIREWTDSLLVTNNPYHTAELAFSFKQPVLKNFLGYVDRRSVKLARIDAEIADLSALDRIENAVADIEKAYWRLVFSCQNAALREELLSQAEELFNIFEGHLEMGIAETTEIYETEANMRIRKTELEIARNDLKTASNNLKLLLNEDGDFLILPTDRLTLLEKKVDMVESLNEAFAGNREYRAKKKALTGKKIKLKMKANSLWPEVDLVGTFALNGVNRKFENANRLITTDKNPYYYAGVEFTVPIENSQARGEYNKASFEKEKAIIEILQVEKEIITTIDEEVRDVNLTLETAKRWTKIKEIQYAKFTDEEKKLKYGRSTSKILIDYQNDFIFAAIHEYTAVLHYYTAIIDLENEKDTLLEKVGVLGL